MNRVPKTVFTRALVIQIILAVTLSVGMAAAFQDVAIGIAIGFALSIAIGSPLYEQTKRDQTIQGELNDAAETKH